MNIKKSSAHGLLDSLSRLIYPLPFSGLTRKENIEEKYILEYIAYPYLFVRFKRIYYELKVCK